MTKCFCKILIFKTRGIRENSLKNSTVSPTWELSVAEKLKAINYAKERIIHTASNYYGVSRPTIRYWIKE